MTPNLAARLQAIAGPNEIVIAPIAHKLAGDLFDCRDLGSVVLKGFEEPVRAWRVLGRRIVESPFDARHEASISPLVGRRTKGGIGAPLAALASGARRRRTRSLD